MSLLTNTQWDEYARNYVGIWTPRDLAGPRARPAAGPIRRPRNKKRPVFWLHSAAFDEDYFEQLNEKVWTHIAGAAGVMYERDDPRFALPDFVTLYVRSDSTPTLRHFWVTIGSRKWRDVPDFALHFSGELYFEMTGTRAQCTCRACASAGAA